jgi:hypothetical protein
MYNIDSIVMRTEKPKKELINYSLACEYGLFSGTISG